MGEYFVWVKVAWNEDCDLLDPELAPEKDPSGFRRSGQECYVLKPGFPALEPVEIKDVAGALELALTKELACARTASGTICWGDPQTESLSPAPAGHARLVTMFPADATLIARGSGDGVASYSAKGGLFDRSAYEWLGIIPMTPLQAQPLPDSAQ